MADHPVHPAAEIFPLMSGAEFDALVADIREHGLREPIILHDGMILDGRNRQRACRAAGTEARFEDWAGDGTPEAFVVSMNLHRRHLNESQRAMIAARLATLPRGGDRSQQSKVEISTLLPTAAKAATLLNVSRASVVNARKVLNEGTSEEIEAVTRGDAAVGTIAQKIRAKVPAPERKARRGASLAETGRNPERIQRQKINAEIWGRVRANHRNSIDTPSSAKVLQSKVNFPSLSIRYRSAVGWNANLSLLNLCVSPGSSHRSLTSNSSDFLWPCSSLLSSCMTRTLNPVTITLSLLFATVPANTVGEL
jgi:hypothetical protein